MFVIVAYDVKQKRVGKLLKICRKYLVHVQKSVFEGALTEAKLKALKSELKRSIDCDYDAICIYSTTMPQAFYKEQIGVVEKHPNII
ncbi:MAG: CRISPR-associated endonuclease Cas2 [Lachnospiraceae bacterium]|nr:CRISPR-associated endonuclease Cas2 [Lachnospiraceae bacterium]